MADVFLSFLISHPLLEEGALSVSSAGIFLGAALMSPWGGWEHQQALRSCPEEVGVIRAAAACSVSPSQVSQERVGGGGVGRSSWLCEVWVFRPSCLLGRGPPLHGANCSPRREAEGAAASPESRMCS